MQPGRLLLQAAAAALAALLVATAAHGQPACPTPSAGAQRLHKNAAGGPDLQAWWHTEPAALRVGQPFAVLVTLCPVMAQLLRVDAHMPEHRHGMNYRPTLQALGAGRWRAEGLLWHMPGRWELVLEARIESDDKHRLTQTVLLR